MLRPGDTFDKYVVEGLLASGGMGELYVVRHQRTRKRCALKVILPHLCTDPDMVERFLQEAQIGARIEDREHVVEVFDAGRDASGSPWLVMELLSGRDLGHVLDRARRLSPATVVEILRQTAEALDNAHAKGVVHRDIKPENLFIVARPGKPNVVKVLDFGIAKILEQQTHTGTTAGGTIAYMAPEQGEGRSIGPRADVWPLGLIAYRAIVGRPYWMGDSAFAIMKELVADELAPASDRAAEQNADASLDAAFDDFFARCVNRDPDARFATAGGAVTALAAALGVTTRVALSIPEATPDENLLTASPPSDGERATPGASVREPPTDTSTSPPSSRRNGTDLEVDVRVAERAYQEQRKKQLRLVLLLALVPLAVVGAILFGLHTERRATDQKRRDAWASFLACATGESGSIDVRTLRREVELAKILDRVNAAGFDGDPSQQTKETKNDLLPCVPHAKAVAEFVARDDAKGVTFGMQMDQLAKPAGLAPEFVTDALEAALDASSGIDLGGGAVSPSVVRPKRVAPAVDARAAGTLTIPVTSADDVGTTMLRGGGVRRRSFRTSRATVVCDFERGRFTCGAFKVGKLAGGSVVSAPPLGDTLLVHAGRGMAFLPRADAAADPIEAPDAWTGTDDGVGGARLARGKPEAGEVTFVRVSQRAETIERTLDTRAWTDPRVIVAWDKTLLLGRDPPDPKGSAAVAVVDEAGPSRVLDVPREPGAAPRPIGEIVGYNSLYAGCRAGDATYVYLFDTSNQHRGGLVTWLGDRPATLRFLPVGGYLDVTCDDTGIAFSGRVRCGREGECVDTPSSMKTEGWGGCTDGVSDYSIVAADDAWMLWKGPAGGTATASVLLDVADIVLEPPSFACGSGFAYVLLRSKSNTRVVDLTSDPPHML